MSTGDSKFYNKVAKKFGGYKSGTKKITVYPNEDPEQLFKKKLLEYSGKEIVALDVGCADGRNTLALAHAFKQIVAIDMSEEMLDVANRSKAELNINNVTFELQDAQKTSYNDKAFDVIYSRRGPTHYSEFYRILKMNGVYVEIQIGENDARSLKEVFGRGQDYGEWGKPKLQRNKEELEKSGFEVIFSNDSTYDEFYESNEDLMRFLQAVPIFVDFDPVADEKFLNHYKEQNKSKKGILLPRHRIIIVALKNG